jgi:hypothetical protein
VRKIMLSALAVTAILLGGATSATANTDAPDISRATPRSRTAVKCVQIALNDHYGNHLAEDGIFGAETERTVLKLQREAVPVLRTDGIVGNNTGQLLWNTLDRQDDHRECYRYLPTLR